MNSISFTHDELDYAEELVNRAFPTLGVNEGKELGLLASMKHKMLAARDLAYRNHSRPFLIPKDEYQALFDSAMRLDAVVYDTSAPVGEFTAELARLMVSTFRKYTASRPTRLFVPKSTTVRVNTFGIDSVEKLVGNVPVRFHGLLCEALPSHIAAEYEKTGIYPANKRTLVMVANYDRAIFGAY